MSDRRRLWCSVVALALTFGISPVARADAPAAPVLWDSVLRSPDGQPTSGEVVAYVRPPAAELQPGDQLVEIARVQTDDSGWFVVRAFPSPAFRAAQDPSGWVTVMLFAFSKDRVVLATDAVAWRPDPGFKAQSADSPAKGRWITSPTDLIAPADRFRAAEAPSTPDTERPESLTLDGKGERAIQPLGAGAKPAHTNCGLMKSKDMGIHDVAVGELDLGDAWGGFFEYTNTKSTSFQTGVSYSGRGWQVGGSDSMTATSSLGQGKTITPALREEPQLTTYKAELKFKRFEWRCTRNGYSWEDIATLQPVSWPNGGMRERVGGLGPTCGNDKRYFGTVVPGGTLTRRNGSSITLDGAFSVVGFTAGVTSTVASGVGYQWKNDHPLHRAVCGSTDTLNRNTRVTTSGVV